MNLNAYIHQHTQFAEKAIQNTVKLLEGGATIPFISRYRKEATGGLDEVEIETIVKAKSAYEGIMQRKETILKSIDDQGALTLELKNTIELTYDMVKLEDLYLPFKRSKKTKAEVARKKGLEPLAKMIMGQRTDEIEFQASKFLSAEVNNEDEALEGARHIIAEWISENEFVRNTIRYSLERFAILDTKVINTKKENEEAQKYRDYFDWNEPLNRIPSHRFLAIRRGETEGFLKVKVEIDDERTLDRLEQKLLKAKNEAANQVKLALVDAYKRLLMPSLTNEVLHQAKTKADEEAISVFSNNLRQLLLAPPLGEKRILAIDPGFRTGCKVVCLDAQGALTHNETLYPHPPQKQWQEAIKKLTSLADAHKIEAIAIGNGTASRETESLVKQVRFKNEVSVFVVSEAGASIYSASKIARQEFPNYDVTVRGAVSIGRRLADPLAELVKIDPKSIGVGQYQHDVDQTKLKESLDTVVMSCVNGVGVNVNTASESLLSYVAGIGPKLAENMVKYRNQMGGFTSRAQIKEVPRLGDKAFEQAAGFLRIKDGDNPLDDSAVHPERYALVSKMAQDQQLTVTQLLKNKSAISKINLPKYQSAEVGLPTLMDIIEELEKPGLDRREKAKAFTFDQNIRSIEDLREGHLLPGIVNNITNFGCFVDIGIKESGLIHISNLSDTFIKDVNAVVQLHQQLIVKVLQVDIPRKRIQLKLHKTL